MGSLEVDYGLIGPIWNGFRSDSGHRSCQEYVLQVCSFMGDDVQAKIEEIFEGLDETEAAEKLMMLAQRQEMVHKCNRTMHL